MNEYVIRNEKSMADKYILRERIGQKKYFIL